jgi:ankyrin repeat protein
MTDYATTLRMVTDRKMSDDEFNNLSIDFNNNYFNQQDNDGNTLIHLCIDKRLEYVLRNGSNPNIRNNEGKIPLRKANTLKRIKLLLTFGSEFSQEDKNYLLIKAKTTNETFKYLIEQGATLKLPTDVDKRLRVLNNLNTVMKYFLLIKYNIVSKEILYNTLCNHLRTSDMYVYDVANKRHYHKSENGIIYKEAIISKNLRKLETALVDYRYSAY